MSVAINASPPGALNQGGFSKRSRTTSDDEADMQAETKRTRYSWYFKLERESPAPTDEDKESIYTVQGYETEFARDTSDTSTHTWITDSDSDSDVAIHVGVEYELDSRSENENLSSSMSSSSEPENIFAVEFITIYDSEGMVADDSDVSMCSMDTEIRTSAFRTCVQCGTPNNNSLYQYCRICYQKRKTYFPRPRRKTRSSSKISKKSNTTTVTTSTARCIYEMDSGLGSSQPYSTSASSQEMDNRSLRHSDDTTVAFDSQRSETPMSESQSSVSSLKVPTILGLRGSRTPLSASRGSETPTFDSQGSELMVFESQGSETSLVTMTSAIASQDEVDSGVTSKDEHSSSQESFITEKYETAMMMRQALKRLEALEKEGSAPPMLCIICYENKRDSVFNHGATGHQCCCYKCAKKVCMSNSNRCPLCNRVVSYISKIFLE